jgi:hypothetical protein
MSQIITCQIHQRPEPDLPGDFKACGECWHVWRTEAEFRADLAEWHGEAAWTMPLDQVWACPLCTHDF